MKVRLNSVRGIVFCLTLVLCYSLSVADEYKDAKKAYEMGQNDVALRLLVIKLRKDSDHQDAIALFKLVLPLVIDRHQKTAQDYESQKDWDNAFMSTKSWLKSAATFLPLYLWKKLRLKERKSKSLLRCPKLTCVPNVRMLSTMLPKRIIKKVFRS